MLVPTTANPRHPADAALALTARLVNTASPNPPGDERAVVAVVREQMAELGLPEPEVYARDPTRPNLIMRVGTGEPNLLLAAHLDTMPPGDRESWKSDPYRLERRGSRLYGLGVADMKGAVAAALLAIARVAREPEDSGARDARAGCRRGELLRVWDGVARGGGSAPCRRGGRGGTLEPG